MREEGGIKRNVKNFLSRTSKGRFFTESYGKMAKCRKGGMRVKDMRKYAASEACKKGRQRRENERK